jgi:prevent-host-death family protein
MTHGTDTTSFNDFRNRLRDHLDQSKATGRPLLIKENGETEAVVLSPATFDELMDQAELARSLTLLDHSADDIRAGRVKPAKGAIKGVASEFGLKLDR